MGNEEERYYFYWRRSKTVLFQTWFLIPIFLLLIIFSPLLQWPSIMLFSDFLIFYLFFIIIFFKIIIMFYKNINIFITWPCSIVFLSKRCVDTLVLFCIRIYIYDFHFLLIAQCFLQWFFFFLVFNLVLDLALSKYYLNVCFIQFFLMWSVILSSVNLQTQAILYFCDM